MSTPNFLPVPEVKYEKKTAILGEFQIKIHGSVMNQKMQDAFAQLQKKVSMPGFRPGKMPLPLVKQKYHEDVLHDVFQKVVSESYRDAAIKNKVPVVGEPMVTKSNLQEWEEGKPLECVAQVDLLPEVEVKKYKGLPVTKKDAKIKEEDVEIVLKNLLEPRAELLPVDEKAKIKKGHIAIIDFEGSLDGKVLPDASAKNFFLEVGSPGSLEEFQGGLIGMRTGEEKEITVPYKEDYKNAEVAGKTVVYKVKVHELKEKKYPELTDEIAKDFQADSVADLNKKIRASLEDELKVEQEQQLQEETLLAFVEANPLDVPPSLVQRQMQFILQDVAQLLRKQKFSDNLIQDYFTKHLKEFQARAEREVKLALLLPKVVEKEKLEITDEDFKAHFDEIVKSSGQNIEAIEKFYTENQSRKEELRRDLQRRKAIKLLASEAKAK